MPKVRLNLFLSKSLYQDLVEMADTSGVSMADVLRCALALLKVAHDGKRAGMHFDICDDPANLDREIIGLI